MADNFGLEIYGSPKPGETSEDNVFYSTREGNARKPIIIDSLTLSSNSTSSKTYNMVSLGLKAADAGRLSVMCFRSPGSNYQQDLYPAASASISGSTLYVTGVAGVPSSEQTSVIVYLK